VYSSTSCQLELADAEEAAVTSAASIIAAQAPMASARRKDPMAVLLLCPFVLLDGVNNPGPRLLRFWNTPPLQIYG
jgi:hypothetical protein